MAILDCAPPAQPSQKNRKIINLSLPRTATTSFAGIFHKFKSTHEFMQAATINSLLDYREKKISAADLKAFLHKRDKLAGHAIDSAAFFFLAPDVVIETFPDANFFFSLRDCESWIVSMVDNSVFAHKLILENKATSDRSFLDRYSNYFIKNHQHAVFEDMSKLRQNATHITVNLAQVWYDSSLRTLIALEKVSADRRLIIRTRDFNKSLPAMAALAGLPPEALDATKIHLNKDRDLAFYRNVLGPTQLTTACNPHEQAMEMWIQKHHTGL